MQSSKRRIAPAFAASLGAAALVTAAAAVTRFAGGQVSLPWLSHCAASPSNLLVITLDTTRADALGAYGNRRAHTPALDRLAREGMLFEQTSSVAPLTLPAHASLFTGRLPVHHGARENGAQLADTETTLAEVLSGRGMQTAAFVGAVVLSARSGIAQGFETFVDHTAAAGGLGSTLRRASGDAVADAALAWFRGRSRPERPFFAWVHLYDAHAPYRPPEPFRSRFADDPYAGAVSYADAQVARLIAELEGQQRLDDTVVVVLGDHGESLGDHGELTHGLFLYESVLRVPLIVRAPCVAGGARIVSVVRTTDVMPTVLGLLGLVDPTPPRDLDGIDLAPRLSGITGDEELEAYAENVYPRSRFGWSELRSLRAGRFKLIVTTRPELYDLALDPGEQRNLFHERPRLADALLTRLLAIEAGAPSPGAGRAGLEEPARHETAAELAALGYVARGSNVEAESRAARGGAAPPLPDPKDHVTTFNRLTTPQGWQP